MNPWITFVKEWVKENNVPYSQAIKDPRVSDAYKRMKRQSDTQQVARNVSQGKLADIAAKAKAMPPKPKPLPPSSAVKAVFDSPYVRQKIMAFKPSVEEIERRRQKKKDTQLELADTATKQMIRQGIPYEEIFGQTREDTRKFVSLVEVMEEVNNIMYGLDDYAFSESDNDPNKQIKQLEDLIKKLRPLFKRDPIDTVDGIYTVDFDSIGIQVDYDSDREEDIDEETGEVYPPTQYAFFTDEAKKEMKEWVDIAKNLYKNIHPVAKKSRPAPVRRPKSK